MMAYWVEWGQENATSPPEFQIELYKQILSVPSAQSGHQVCVDLV